MPLDQTFFDGAAGQQDVTPPPNVYQSVPQDNSQDANHQALLSLLQRQAGISANRNLGISDGQNNPSMQVPQQQDPHPVRSYLSNWLHNIGEVAKAQSGLPTELETQTAQVNNQLKQVQAQQYKMVPYQLDDGTTIQVQQKDVGALAGRIGASQNALQGHLAGVNAALAKGGYQMTQGPDGTPTVSAIPREQLSEQQKSQLDTNQATIGLKNAQQELASAKAAGVPQQIAIAQSKVSAYQQIANAMGINAQSNAQNAQTNAGNLDVKRQEFQAKYGVTQNPDGSKSYGSDFLLLRPQAQQTLAEMQPKIQQLDALIKQLEPMKDDDTRGAFLADRLAYATGSAGPGNAAQQVADLELGKIQNSAALAKGNSRNYQFIQDIYKHQPNLYTDSNKLVYEKLQNIRQNLQRIEDVAITYGNKTGVTPNPNAQTAPNAPPPQSVDPVGDYISKVRKGK